MICIDLTNLFAETVRVQPETMARTKQARRVSIVTHRVRTYRDRPDPLFTGRIDPMQSDTPLTIVTEGNQHALQYPANAVDIIVNHVASGVRRFRGDSWDGLYALQKFAHFLGTVNDFDDFDVPNVLGVSEDDFTELCDRLKSKLFRIWSMCNPSKQPLPIKFIPNRIGSGLNYAVRPLVETSGRPPNQYDIFTSWLKVQCNKFDPDDFCGTIHSFVHTHPHQWLSKYNEVQYSIPSHSSAIYITVQKWMIVLMRNGIPREIRRNVWCMVFQGK